MTEAKIPPGDWKWIREAAEQLAASLQEETPDRETALGLELLEEELRGRQLLRTMRETWAPRIFIVLCVWLATTLVILFLQGFKVWDFHLHKYVLAALVGSTAVNVVGLFGIIARFVFPAERT